MHFYQESEIRNINEVKLKSKGCFQEFDLHLSFRFLTLFQHGGLLSTQDKEGLSVLDLTMKDRPTHVVFKNTGKKN